MMDEGQAQDITLEEQCAQQALVLQRQVGEMVVSDDMSFKKMESMEKTAKDNVKSLETQMAVQIDDAHKKHKKLTKLRNDLTSPFKAVAKEARSKCLAYAAEQQRIAREEAARVAEELRKREEETRLAAAEAAEKSGKSEEAEKILEAPAMPAPAVPVKEVVKVKGARENWTAKINDPKLMFRSLGSDEGITPDLTEAQCEDLCRVLSFHTLARSLRGNLETMIPGVVAVRKMI